MAATACRGLFSIAKHASKSVVPRVIGARLCSTDLHREYCAIIPYSPEPF
ncbi:hypothetical protein E2C01_088578 [Portunus trituberculatus]|uniref:Uncharacterized protein n=1 Tax=Portunus trituberculatus TaxID=210409 RepID=A0A5B7J9N6_PORTR|nr:hypothetical protein [Portunus trituberculatus]